MSSPQTVLLPIDLCYKDREGVEKVHRCFLNLSLSIAELDATTSTSLEDQGFGEITIQGAVMPVDDPRDGVPAPEMVTVEEDEMDQAVAA